MGAGQTEDPLIEKRVSFIESKTFSEGSEQNNRPIINIIASTPVQYSASLIYLEYLISFDSELDLLKIISAFAR